MNDRIASENGDNLVLQNVKGSKMNTLTIYGHSTQDGTPSPENPVPIVSAGDSGEIEAKVYGGNLISSDISSWNGDGWGAFNDTVLQLSDGIKIKAINGWAKACYDTYEMNGKTLNLSFDYRQIESETTSPTTRQAFAVVVQDENIFPSEASDIFPFQIDSPETVKTHVSVSFIARNYLCLYLRVNTEGQEAGETRAIEVTNIMLNAGSTALAFEPYVTPQTLILSTPGGLPGIPVSSGGNYTDENGQQWICDEVDFKRGKYVQRTMKYTFDGSDKQAWRRYSGGFYIADALEDGEYTRKPGLSNQFFVRSNTETTLPGLWIGVNNSFLYSVYNEFYDDSLPDFGLANWKAHLAAHPLEVMTYLETPIETDLSDEEMAAYKALHTYSPTTTVSNDAGAWMKVGYREWRR